MTDTAQTAADPAPNDGPTDKASTGKTGLTDSIRAAFAGDAPIADKFRALYKARPVATVALAGVVGIALLNTLRGRN